MKEKRQIEGKKIIFVNPPEIVGSKLLNILTEKEFEVYTLLDYKKISDIHKKYSDAIFFLNIDVVLTEFEWDQFILDLNHQCPEIQFGIFSFKITDKSVMQYYFMDLGVNCGFIQLKLGVAAATEMMLKIMIANEVKGRRKYIRYKCCDEDKTALFIDLMGTRVTGEVLDISSVGMSCILDNHKGNISQNELIRHVQLRLRGLIVILDAILLGTRVIEGERTIFVFLFKEDCSDKVKSKIRSFISISLQKQFNREFSLRN